MKSRRHGMLRAFSAITFLGPGCSASHTASPTERDAAFQTDAAADSCRGDACGGPVCDGVWRNGPLDEVAEIPVVCEEQLAHEPASHYDDCRIEGGSSSPEACHAPRSGAIVCEPGTGAQQGRLTTTCLSDGDCPPEYACAYDGQVQPIDPDVVYSGVCERRCDDDRACLRCDLECAVGAAVPICRNRQGPPLEPRPCVADCQCEFPSGNICHRGFCIEVDGLAADGCGPESGCECNGGTCGEDGCCYLPDGSVAPKDDPICSQP